ncbi:hexokinase_2 domain-containing protein [Nephila pilipes]|uniref:Hexokinase_2 domain-containing protein n=1 Tax=Nephila pilipes TaxID=299642 RepID=A0A8X6QHE5_NEPPI|nr:hexokinase_2 domain-containing protein [Nephila pilipes]
MSGDLGGHGIGPPSSNPPVFKIFRLSYHGLLLTNVMVQNPAGTRHWAANNLRKSKVLNYVQYISKSSDVLFDIAEKSLAKELESNIHYHGKFRENIQLNVDDGNKITSWDQVYQSAYDLIIKDMEKVQKLGLKEKIEDPNANQQYLDIMEENLPHWIDIFLDAADEKIKERNLNQLDQLYIFEQHLKSQALPSWNELLYIMYNYSKKDIQKKLFTDDIGILADYKDISNIKSMVIHDEFCLDHIILAVIEEFLKDNDDICKGNINEGLESDKTTVLNILEKKIDKNEVSKNEKNEMTNNEYLKRYSWRDLLPTQDTEKKFQVEEELLETKIKLENPTLSFKEEKIPNDLIWRHIFPLAVLVWKKNLGDYLNFQKMSTSKLSNVSYSRAHELELLKIKLNQERERLKKFTDNVALKSKKLISERFNIQNDDSAYDVMSSSEHVSKTGTDKIKFYEAEKFEKLEPQYFSVTASWREIFFAAVERNRKILYKLLDLRKDYNEKINHNSKTDIQDKMQAKEIFSANNVLDLTVTIQELFDAVNLLQQKNLIVYNHTIIEDTNYISENIPKDRKNIKAFDVIDIFKSILHEGLLTRRKELSLLEQELWKLEIEDKDVESNKASSALRILWKYYNAAAKFRDKENKTITFELENLKELKHMFQEYVDFSVNEALQQRNKKQIRSMKHSYHDIQMIQGDFDNKLMSHLDRCVGHCNSLLANWSDPKFQIDMKTVETLLGRLDLKEQELFRAAKQILVSITNLRNTDMKNIEKNVFKIQKKEAFIGSLENKLSEFLSSFTTFVSEGFEERNNLNILLVQGINFLKDAKNNVSTKIKNASGTSKQYLINSMQRNKNEVEVIQREFDTLKLKVDRQKRKVADIILACENFVQNVLEKRCSEISSLGTYMRDIYKIKVSEFYTCCIDHFSNAIEKRNQEVNEIKVLMEPLKIKDEELDQEVSAAIDEALCEAFGIQQGMTFFKIQDERTETLVGRLDPETISLCNDFYSRLIETIQNDIKVIEEDLDSLNLYKEDIAEELIQILSEFIGIVEKENEALKTETDMLASAINLFKENQKKLLIDVNKVLNVCRDHFTKNLKEISEDIEGIKFQLVILARGNVEEEKIEKFIPETTDDDLKSIFPANTFNTNLSEQKENEGKHEITNNIFPEVVTVLQFGINWRDEFIKSLSDAVEGFSDFRNKSLEVITICFENYFLIGEQRRKENQKVEHTSNSLKNVEESDFSKACKDCLEDVYFFNLEAFKSIEYELDRLTNTIEFLEKEKKKVLMFCEENISFIIYSREEEIKTMNSDLSYLSYMGSTESSEFLSKCEKLLHDGIDDRKKEVTQLKNLLKNFSIENYVVIVVSACERHLELTCEKRLAEVQNVQELLHSLGDESDMGSLLYSPVLKAFSETNNEAMEFLVPQTYTFLCIRKKLEHEDQKLIGASRKLYCTMLETFKIEKESIVWDMENLQEIMTEKSEVADSENREAIISFNDLFVITFNMKKTEYERDIRKKLLQEDVEKKKTDILASVKDEAVDKISDIAMEEDVEKKKTDILASVKDETVDKISDIAMEAESLAQFIKYFEAKNLENKKKIEKKIIKDLCDLEEKLKVDEVKTTIQEPTSVRDINEKESESIAKSEKFVNRVYEIKVLEIEKEIDLKHVKISNVIKQRKIIMEDIIKSKRQKMEESVLIKGNKMRYMIDTIKSEDSQVICTLKDIFNDIVELKNKEKHTLKNKKELEKYIDVQLEERNVWVNLDDIFGAALNIKEEELEMIKQAKFKEIEKIIKIMKREVRKRILTANEKLEVALKKYREHERSKALEYAGITKLRGKNSMKEEYKIPDEEIFPDIKSFKDFVSSYMSPYKIKTKEKYNFISKDSDAKASATEFCIPFIQPHAYALHGLAGYVLKLYESDVQSLSKVVYDLKFETENAIQHGISFTIEEVFSDKKSTTTERKVISFN